MKRTHRFSAAAALGLLSFLTVAVLHAPATFAQTKTRVVDYVRDPAGNPLSGEITFTLTRRATAGTEGSVAAGPSVSAALDSQGKFDVWLHPTASLSPAGYYQVYVTSGAGTRTRIGRYNIPPSGSAVTLSPHEVTEAAGQSLLRAEGGVLDLMSGSPAVTRLRVERNGDISFGSDGQIKFGSRASKPRELFSRTGVFGNVLSGHVATLNVFTDPNNEGSDWVAWFSHEGSAVNNEALMRLQHFSQGYAPQPVFTGIAARGTRASPSAVQSGDYLLILDGRGYDGSGTSWREYAPGFSDTSAQIALQAAGNWSGSSHPSRIVFKATAPGSTSPTEVATVEGGRLNVLGQLVLGGAATHINTPGANSDIAGVLTVSAATSAAKTFTAAYGNPPVCVLTPLQDMGAVRWWVERTQNYVKVNVSAAGNYRFDYQCKGNPN